MKIDLTPLQMAILAQVFARDDAALDDKRAAHALATPAYVNVLDKRIDQATKLRAEINRQISAADQRAIVVVSHSAA